MYHTCHGRFRSLPPSYIEYDLHRILQVTDQSLEEKLLTIDQRGRGFGGVQCCCGEEYLLDLAADQRYQGRDILSHEFAHTIMDFGLLPALRTKIEVHLTIL